MRKSLSLVLMLFFMLPVMMLAQGVTTGSFNGTVYDADHNPLAGVDVVIVHEPTGTKYRTITRTNGFYNVPSVRVGGPYTVTASLEGLKTGTQENINVKLGDSRKIDFTLSLETVDAGEVLVTGASPIINAARTGASQNVAQESIENLPSISRDISSFTRLAPQFVQGEDSGSFSAAGRSPRYNNIQIDGAQNNDLFGLGNSGAPGGQTMTTPISLDAIQEFQIVLAPYDVRHGMFTGGGVNVVTKNGTNDYHGSAFMYTRGEGLVGLGPNNIALDEFSEKSYGLTLGGPIVKNKLFFFLSGELKEEKSQKDLNYWIDGSGEEWDYGNKEEADLFLSILQDRYGYDAGSYGPASNDFKSTQLFIRFDLNISEAHQLTLRHNFVDAEREIFRRDSRTSFSFENGGYMMESTTNSTVLQLNSTLSQNLFNELTLNYSTIRDKRGGQGEDFPNIFVQGVGFGAGTEAYSTANQLDQDLIEITDNMTIFAGNHTFTVGTHNEFFKFYNVFVPRNFGAYTFDSMDDFEAGLAERFRYTYAASGTDGASEFSCYQLGFYAGDQWRVSPRFNLTLGIRADVPIFPDDPMANPAVLATFGIPTDHAPGGNVLLSPRIGFNYELPGKKKTQIRGGVGIFSGRTPFVWISNQYGNTGMTLNTVDLRGDYMFVADPYNQPIYAANRSADINLHDDSYKFPQTLRTNIAVDQELPFGFTGTLEFIYSKAVNEIKYQNINLQQVGTQTDGRPLYGHIRSGDRWTTDYISSDFYNVILLTNTNKGFNYSASAQLQKELAGGGMLNFSYAYGVSKDLFSGTSSQAISNWRFNITAADPNNPNLSYSSHDTRHRIAAAMIKVINIVEGYPTTFSIFYDGRSGRPYSTIYRYDFNGDGQSNDSIYVPTDSNDIVLVDPSKWDDLNAYIEADPALRNNRGKILPRNANRDPWFHKVDIKIAQEIKIPGLKGHKLQLTFDVENVLNWFNKNYGVYKYIQYNDSPLQFKGYNDEGQATFDFIGETDTDDARYIINQEMSRWKAMFGIKYKF
ncbi:MAG: TonB-dependent receptor [bacterium]|nr:TonB-dependent receptor [bacterium]